MGIKHSSTRFRRYSSKLRSELGILLLAGANSSGLPMQPRDFLPVDLFLSPALAKASSSEDNSADRLIDATCQISPPSVAQFTYYIGGSCQIEKRGRALRFAVCGRLRAEYGPRQETNRKLDSL